MTYFVTGATGFIGRHLVEQLLKRDGDIHVLVREGSTDKLDALIALRRDRPRQAGRRRPDRAAARRRRRRARGDRGRRPLLPPRRDLRHDRGRERNEQLNVGGTRNAVDLANALDAERFHHVSSIAAAGHYKGLFREDMFDEGQKLASPYHRTKFESEKIARERVQAPWRVYRPSVVVGHSKTGEMDKIDGPYYFFKAHPEAPPLAAGVVPADPTELGWTNLVPVDYVAAAMDHIAHQDDLDGQAFHLVDPKGQRSGEVLNTFAKAAHAPHAACASTRRMIDVLPKGVLSSRCKSRR